VLLIVCLAMIAPGIKEHLRPASASGGNHGSEEPSLSDNPGRAESVHSRAPRSQADTQRDAPVATIAESGPQPEFSREAAGSLADAPESAALQVSPGYRRIEEVWRHEELDRNWTRSMRDYVEGSLADLKTRGGVRDVSCGKTLCRLQLDFSDPVEATRYAENANDPNATKWVKVIHSGNNLLAEVIVPRGSVAASE
jgi:hypothetical protein